MKKFLAVSILTISLAACYPFDQTGNTIDVTTVINETKQLCSFVPDAAEVVTLINAYTGSTAFNSPIEVAQKICAAVNAINTTAKGKKKFAPGTVIGVLVDVPQGGTVTVKGVIN